MQGLSLLGRALLGLLMQSALSGYDIRRIFTRTPLVTFSDSPGAIYPALKRLEAEGLVRGRVESRAGLRRRRIYRVTPAGASALRSWLSTPITRDDVVHGTDELMLRFGFMDLGIGEAASVRFLHALRQELKTYIPELDRYLDSHGHKMSRSGRLALESGIRSYQALLEWTSDALAAYGNRGKPGKGRKKS